MGGRILVTRPQPEAAKTARRLAALGFEAVELPLTRIVGLPVDRHTVPTNRDFVAVTSANALRHAPDWLIASLVDTPLFAVGGRTAGLARRQGFRDVAEGPGDAAALADTVLAATAPHASILFLCGRERLDRFEAALTSSGRSVHVVETYDTRPVDQDAEVVATGIGSAPVDAVLLYSANAARHFVGLMKLPALTQVFAQARLLCLSGRVAAALPHRNPDLMAVAREPTEAALLSLLGPAANGS